MTMTFTSASANKQIRVFEEEKEHILGTEREASTYVLSVGEGGEPPEYDYEAVRERVAELDGKIRALRCALHAFNVATTLPESGISIDEALVLMAQLNGERRRLFPMRSALPKRRLSASNYYRGNSTVEYEYVNYDIERAEADYQAVSERVRQLQMEIDFANQTIQFEVDL